MSFSKIEAQLFKAKDVLGLESLVSLGLMSKAEALHYNEREQSGTLLDEDRKKLIFLANQSNFLLQELEKPKYSVQTWTKSLIDMQQVIDEELATLRQSYKGLSEKGISPPEGAALSAAPGQKGSLTGNYKAPPSPNENQEPVEAGLELQQTKSPSWRQRLSEEFPNKIDPDRFKGLGDGRKEVILSVLNGERPLGECNDSRLVDQFRELIAEAELPIRALPIRSGTGLTFIIYRADYSDLRKEYVESIRERENRSLVENEQINSTNLPIEVKKIIKELKAYQRMHDYHEFDGEVYCYTPASVQAFGAIIDRKITMLEERIQSYNLDAEVLKELGLEYLAPDVDSTSTPPGLSRH